MSSIETIAAIATALGSSGISIIRISGPDAFHIIDKIYKNKSGKSNLKNAESHTIHYGYIYDDSEMIDEVLVMFMKGPKSYTAEDTIEINCHGGAYVTQRILEVVLKNGARCADPGEFTKRAFLNGRIDLSKAEAVIDIIQSKNEFALKNSISQLKGSILNEIVDIREKILHEIAFIESALDDPEHISLEGYPEQLLEIVNLISYEIKNILDKSDDGRILKEGINTVILGKPNAGKSSLLNMLIGKEKAIVTNIAGTTRDILEETINLKGITLNLIDTAGIRDTEDIVEKIGVEKAIENAEKADLIIYVVDSSTKLDESDEKIIHLIRNKNVIILLNKTDLDNVVTKDMFDFDQNKIIPISAIDGTGIEELKNLIKKMFLKGDISFNDEIYITNIRQKEALKESYDSMILVKNSIVDQMPEDFFSIDLMNAYTSLGKIIGEEVEEDLVNKIFSSFCMGK